MIESVMIILILLPVAAAILLPFLRFGSRKGKMTFICSVLAAEAVLASVMAAMPETSVKLFSMTRTLQVALKNDGIAKLFFTVTSWGYLLAGIFSVRYMDREEEEGSFPENMFYCFYLASLGACAGCDLASGVIGMYMFFEMVTLLSMPLVLHEKTEASVSAALKYLFYSVAGAFLALGCIFILSRFTASSVFVPGGVIDPELAAGNEKLILTAVFLGAVGFGAKAGMYPLHGWLPTAHPVAPAPASAVLSGIITKAGVVAVIRIVFFTAGTEMLRGTWVQTALLILSLLTVFMGSMMAYNEKVLKKRLAYSSVSQISYVLFGLYLMNPEAACGALMQVIFHASVKICLFLCAGSIIYNTGAHNVDELRGYGKFMPVTFGAFTLASLSLIGIPPFAGFTSKWYLAMGSLSSGISVISWAGPAVLLISALLTAGYLLPITVSAFFPGKESEGGSEMTLLPSASPEGGLLMKIPLIALASFALLAGVFSGTIRTLIESIILF